MCIFFSFYDLLRPFSSKIKKTWIFQHIKGQANQNIIMWMDHRAREETESVNAVDHSAFRFVGTPSSFRQDPYKKQQPSQLFLGYQECYWLPERNGVYLGWTSEIIEHHNQKLWINCFLIFSALLKS